MATCTGRGCMMLRGRSECICLDSCCCDTLHQISSVLPICCCNCYRCTCTHTHINTSQFPLFLSLSTSPLPFFLPPSLPSFHRANRSWQKLYVVLQDSQLFFYTDHKVVKEQPGGKPLVVFPLLQASVSQYNKEKKRNVFQVQSALLNFQH